MYYYLGNLIFLPCVYVINTYFCIPGLNFFISGYIFSQIISEIYFWIQKVKKFSKRPQIIFLESKNNYKIIHQNPYLFYEAAILYTFYKLKIFGTKNIITNNISRFSQNYANKFRNQCETKQIISWANKHKIPLDLWDRHISEYKSIDDFFTRKYKCFMIHPSSKTIISPTEGTVLGYSSIDTMKNLCVKQKNFTLSRIGIPDKFLNTMDKSNVFIFKLDINDVHRVYSPCNGKIIEIIEYLEPLRSSHSIRDCVMKSGWEILTENRRVLLIIETENFGIITLMIVGGISIDSIMISQNIYENKNIKQGQELGTFHMGGSAVVMILSDKYSIRKDIEITSLCDKEFGISIGDNLLD